MSIFSISSLSQIRIILVETSHTGNMGSVARAMKTMGLTQLYLVNPIVKPDSQSIALAAGASDVIQHAIITATLDEAIADCHLVIGSSARSRTFQWPMLTARESGQKIIAEVAKNHDMNVAIIFGRERSGLTNEELQKCHYHVVIPANADYSSLNLAMAVQLISYEIRAALLEYIPAPITNNDSPELLSKDEIEKFYEHLEAVLTEIKFINQTHPGVIMSRLRRLFTRARLEKQEVNILRGILTAIQHTK